MKEKVTCAQRLRQALEIRNMKQSELCALTGIGKSAMSQYLKGTIEPRQDRVEVLAEKLHVAEAWLMGYDVPMEHPDTRNGGGWAGSSYYRQFDTPEGMSRLDDELIKEGKIPPIWTPHGEVGKKLAMALADIPDDKLESVLDYVNYLLQNISKEE